MVQEKTTKGQIEIAKAFNLNIADDLADVGFIKIMNILKSIFDYPIDERPATEKQIAFAKKFGIDVSEYTLEMAGMVLLRITQEEDKESIRTQDLKPGDIVTTFNRMNPNYSNGFKYTISSIKDGMVYFKGGNGKKAFARNIRKMK